MKDAFGAENLYVEVMDHGIAAERKVLPGLFGLAKQFGLKTVATNDSHYIYPDQDTAHAAWLCVGKKTGGKNGRQITIHDQRRFRFNGSGYHLRSAAQMRDLADGLDPEFGKPWLEAVENSLLVASLTDEQPLPDSRLRLPTFPVPTGRSSVDYLYDRVLAGAKRRY